MLRDELEKMAVALERDFKCLMDILSPELALRYAIEGHAYLARTYGDEIFVPIESYDNEVESELGKIFDAYFGGKTVAALEAEFPVAEEQMQKKAEQLRYTFASNWTSHIGSAQQSEGDTLIGETLLRARNPRHGGLPKERIVNRLALGPLLGEAYFNECVSAIQEYVRSCSNGLPIDSYNGVYLVYRDGSYRVTSK